MNNVTELWQAVRWKQKIDEMSEIESYSFINDIQEFDL